MKTRWVFWVAISWAAACGETSPAGSPGAAGIGGNTGGAAHGGGPSAGSTHGGAAGSSALSGSDPGGALNAGGAVEASSGASGSPDVGGSGGAASAGEGGQASPGLGGEGGNPSLAGEGGSAPLGGSGAEAGSGGEGGADEPVCPKPEGELCHELLLTDNSRNVVSYVNEFSSVKPGAVEWTRTVTAVPRSIEIVDNASAEAGKAVLIGTEKGYVELDLTSGQVLANVVVVGLTTARSASRMPDGTTALALAAEIRIVSATGVEQRKFSLPAGLTLGLVQRNPATGNFWLAKTREVYELADTGQVLWNETMPAGAVGQAVWWREGGGAYVTTGDAATLVELDATGAVVGTLGGKATFSQLDFLSGFVRQPNGNFIVANWLGHLASPPSDLPQLVELTPANEIVWTWGTQDLARQVLDVHVLR